MKIVLIGATGFVGSAILKEALQRGIFVTAVVRDVHKLTTRENLSVLQGDVMDTKKLAEMFSGNDAVVSAYNAGWSNPNLYNEFLEGSQSIERAVKESGVARYLVVGGAGSLYVAPNVQAVDTPEFPEAWKPGALAARDYLNILKQEKKLDWTFISPAIEMNSEARHERKGFYRTGGDTPVFDANHKSAISVEDLAVAIVDELENPKHIRERFTVGY